MRIAISSKKGKLYLKFTLALAIIAAVFYSYSAFASAPTAAPFIVNTNGSLSPNASTADNRNIYITKKS